MGLADFFSILAFVLILMVFYLILHFTIGKIPFKLSEYSTNVEDSLSLISILRTPVIVDNAEMNIAELIALSSKDSAKKSLLEKTATKIIEDAFGTSRCAMLCINEQQIKSNGCGTLVGIQACSDNTAPIPGYDGSIIKVSFTSDIQPLNLQSAP